MKLIIHIGTEKTGTSSLQLWGSQNRESLRNNFIFYSKSLGEIDHRKVSVYPLDLAVSDDGLERYGISNNEKFVQFKKQLNSDLKDEVELALSLNCKYFIVSSEHLHSRITSVGMVENVKALFSPYFSDNNIEILCYLRPQADLFQSRLSVGVRNATHSKAELESLWKNDITYFDYAALWDRWSSVFSNVNFKSFNKYKNIIEDVANILSINLDSYITPARVNEKLDYRMGLISFHLRNVTQSISMQKELTNLYLEQIECKEPITISRSLATKINAFYLESNLKLCTKNKDIRITDVEANLKKFPAQGSADKMFEPDCNIIFLIQILIRNYCDIHILKCENAFVQLERALARGNYQNALIFNEACVNLLSKFDGMNFDSEYNLSQFIERINFLKNKLLSVEIKGMKQ